MSYTQFLKEAKQGQIREVKVDSTGAVTGVKRDGAPF